MYIAHTRCQKTTGQAIAAEIVAIAAATSGFELYLKAHALLECAEAGKA